MQGWATLQSPQERKGDWGVFYKKTLNGTMDEAPTLSGLGPTKNFSLYLTCEENDKNHSLLLALTLSKSTVIKEGQRAVM